ncbi:MAG: carbon storage regulator [Polyangiaceae bacterium]
MLVLRRKPGERIVLGDDITVCIASVTNRAVRLAISAPDGVSVLRGEVYDAIVAANQAAAAAAMSDAPPVEESCSP